MQENTVVQETNSINQEQISGQNVVRVVEKQRLWRQSACRSTIISLDR